MNARRRFGRFEFHVKRSEDGFTFEVKGDPEYYQARKDVFRLIDEAVREARRNGVTLPEILAHLARGSREPENPPAAND